MLKIFAESLPVKINLKATSSTGDLNNLSFKIVNAPIHGEIRSFDQKTGVVEYMRTGRTETPDEFTYSVVDVRDGAHSKPGKVTLIPMTVDEAKSAMKGLKSLPGSSGG